MDDFETLKKLAKMETAEDIKEFEVLAWKLAKTGKTDVLNQLISLFDDNHPYQEVMFGLLHIIETYKDEEYVNSVLSNIKIGLNKYPEWACRIINRILNEDKCKKIFHNNMHLADRESLLKLFDLIDTEYPDHHKLLVDFKKEL